MRAAVTIALCLAVASGAGLAQSLSDAMRGATALDKEPEPPRMKVQDNDDIRRVRAFAMQPPVIPHRIDGYQLDRNTNRCLSCHARTRIEESKAIPVSATHYMDRDGTIRGDVSPRRYFCTQCHVPQEDAKPLVVNRYEDFDAVRSRETSLPAMGGGAAKQ